MGQKQLSLFPWPEPRREVQLELFPPTFETMSPRRLTHVDERIYVEMWRKENKRQSEHEPTLLECLLTPEGARYVPYVSDRDSVVATAVIQWLATNCGSSFLYQCEEEIAKLKAIRRPFIGYHWSNRADRDEFPQGTIAEQINEIISAYIPPDRMTCSALQNEILNFVLNILRRGLPPVKKITRRGNNGRLLLHRHQPSGEPVVGEVQAAAVEVNKNWEERQ